MRMVSILTAGMLAVTAPAFSEESQDEVTEQKELVIAHRELTTTQSEPVKARHDAIGLKSPDGKTTLDANAGKAEAAMLNAGSINAASKPIQTQDPLLRRLYVENAGGGLLAWSAIWTALGAHAVGLTGGLLVSYRNSDPKTGQIQTSDVLVCRTTLIKMRSIQAGRKGELACGNDITSAKFAF